MCKIFRFLTAVGIMPQMQRESDPVVAGSVAHKMRVTNPSKRSG